MGTLIRKRTGRSALFARYECRTGTLIGIFSIDKGHWINSNSKRRECIMKKDCDSCGGTGKVLVECSTCSGTGQVNGKDCKTCYTQGQVVEKCGACNGTGDGDEEE